MSEVIGKTSATLFTAIMAASATLHIYWVVGGTWFVATALNMQVEKLPDNLVLLTSVFILGMIAIGYFALVRVTLLHLPLPSWLVGLGLWCTTSVLLAGAVYNTALPRFWDRCEFAPIFFVLAGLPVKSAE